jgi:hypothetical protein
MAKLSKSLLSYVKADSQSDKNLALGFKSLMFSHKFSAAGLSEINLTSLSAPSELTSLGFVNPNASDLVSANLYFFKENLRLYSSLNGELLPYLSYDIVSNSVIRLKGAAVSAIDEIIIGYIDAKPTTGIIGVDGRVIVQTGSIAVGNTDVVVGDPFTWNKYPTQQAGDVLFFLDGALQMRNDTNAAGGTGNYYEIAPSSGSLSNTLRLNTAVTGSAKAYVVVSNGMVAERPSTAVLAKVENLAGQMDAVIQDLAVVTGNPTSNYQTAPNSVDLAMFGNIVKSIFAGGIYDAVVGSAAQVAALQATHTSLQAAHDALAAGSKIYVLNGTYTENVVFTKKMTVEGKGHSAYINGTLTFQDGSDYSFVFGCRWGGNITINTGADGIHFVSNWLISTASISDSGSGNNTNFNIVET